MYGRRGELESDGERVQCHVCGTYWLSLASHAFFSHDLMADEYRAIFELNRTTGLVGPRLRERRVELGRQRARLQPEADIRRLDAVRPTPEQFSAYFTGRKTRLETRLRPRDPDLKRRAYERLSARLKELLADPEWEAAYRSKLAAARQRQVRPRKTITCANCGKTLHVPPSKKTKFCGRPCSVALRQRRAAERLAASKLAAAQRAAARAPLTRTCPICGRSFLTTPARDQKTCSRPCATALARQRARERQREVTCGQCGQTFFAAGTANQVTCSRACSMRLRWGGRLAQVACASCGTVFSAYPSQHRKTCGRPCAAALRRQIASARRAARTNESAEPARKRGHPPEQRTCPICGTTFLVPRKRRNRARACSRPCANRLNARASKERASEHVTCATCGRTFTAPRSQQRRACSPACSLAYLTRLNAERGAQGPTAEVAAQGRARLKELQADPAWRAAWIARLSAASTKNPPRQVVCENCGQAFLVSERRQRRFCGPPCWAAWEKRARKGQRFGPKREAAPPAAP